MSSNEFPCPLEECLVICKDMAALEEHQLSHRHTVNGTTYRPSIFTGNPDPQDAVPSTSGLNLNRINSPPAEPKRQDAPMDLGNPNYFSDIESDEEIEVQEVKIVKKKKMIGLTYKQIEEIQLDNEKNDGNGDPLIYWQHVANEQEPDDEDFACQEEGCQHVCNDLATYEEHQLSHAENAEDEEEDQFENAEEAEGNASVLSNLSPSVGDLEDIEQIQQDLIREMSEVRRSFFNLIRRVDRLSPDIIRLKRLVDGAGRIPDRNQ